MINSKKDVFYYYDPMIATYTYGENHPMKPLRVAVTDQLVRKFQLYPKMDVFNLNDLKAMKQEATDLDFMKYHHTGYVKTIKSTSTDSKISNSKCQEYNFGDDTPLMDRLYEYCQSYTTGSCLGANVLVQKNYKYAINWSGGLHHAKYSKASGFCYINDCVLAILELLKVYQRVLYIDIDIHHGDGVEQAFYLTDRVMTCSFHKYKNFFPGTGHFSDIGKDVGLYHSVNFPLESGLDDNSFIYIFKSVISKIMNNFMPEAIVFQCGTDSLSGDRLGCFNLSIGGHGEAIKFIKQYNVPTLFLGGGGYTIRNVARCWAYQTSLIVGQNIQNIIPSSDFKKIFIPEETLDSSISTRQNRNTQQQLESIIQIIYNNLNQLVNRPGAQININQNMPVQQQVNVSQIMQISKEVWQQNKDNKNSDFHS